MPATGSGRNLETALPIVEIFGLNTAKPVDFSGSPTAVFPTNSTIDGSPVMTEDTVQLMSEFTWLGQWLTMTVYAINDCIYENGNGYVCLIAHTSGTFSTDLSNGDWSLFVSQGIQGIQGIQGPTGPVGTNVNLLYGTSTTGPVDAADGTLYVTYIP